MPLFDSSRVIGSVASVESERILVQLDEGAPALVKPGSSGILPVGAINSYLVIAAGPHRVVAVITAVRITEDATRRTDPIDDTIAARYIEATLIGRFEGNLFTPGLVSFPALFAPVAAASPIEIRAIFRPSDDFKLRLGDAVVAPEQDVLLDPDALLTRHFAVFGSTGSGKSCTVSAILEGLADLNTPSATVIVFDANGEYERVANVGKTPWRTLKLGLSPDTADARLIAPHWLMNMREHVELVQASQGVQEPLLQRAVLEAKLRHDDSPDLVRRLDLIAHTVSIIRAISESNGTIQPQIIRQFGGLEKILTHAVSETDIHQCMREILDSIAKWKSLKLSAGTDAKPNFDKLDIVQTAALRKILQDVEEIILKTYDSIGIGHTAEGNADAPHYYSLERLLFSDLPRVINIEAMQDPRIKSFASSLILRIGRLVSDDRYSFITRVGPLPLGLESFLRLLLGHWPPMEDSQPWRFTEQMPAQERYQAVTIDLSEVSSDVLIPITSLIARIIIEFAQRCRPRARYPVLLVLEEAHRYIPASDGALQPFAMRSNVFERIAKEGRKFGVSLCVASQRPSELSKTVVSQCGTLIAHRIVNPDDQDLIRFSSPIASRDVLRQLPSLAKQHAIVLGEAVPGPTYVRIRDVACPPRSHDPSFFAEWGRAPDAALDVEVIREVAQEWEKVRNGDRADRIESGSTEEA
jgi:hypothetical protein